MKKLDINFVGRGARSPWAGRVLLAVSLALSLEAAVSYKDVRASLELNNAKIAAARPRSAPVPAPKVSAEETAAARETVERLGLPWDKLFAALESAASEKVALLGIEPDPKSGTVVISGDSKDYLAALSYVLNLSQAQALSHVQLVRHEVKQNDPQGTVSFAVSAAWSEGKQ
jgi:type IV pilus assembly PilN-like protein